MKVQKVIGYFEETRTGEKKEVTGGKHRKWGFYQRKGQEEGGYWRRVEKEGG
jgi:hypothetical protein